MSLGKPRRSAVPAWQTWAFLLLPRKRVLQLEAVSKLGHCHWLGMTSQKDGSSLPPKQLLASCSVPFANLVRCLIFPHVHRPVSSTHIVACNTLPQ
ncbi:uncharacterized protein BDZ83DRAFT_610530 [Colletotrichum acutatum]|uniref:Uncharacterized protein n=1 Tax=Glomerella acutata TaxID=27357 RepID=A0AAD8UUZ5_GLOAC|nr:uncharacterized protein BDZ83DRAFT_610530 [Colletotrichum acutatum]KAK1728179.1 hypothetical protein BDZ83DRAFT_610530 [Colletotrichum acutatum]